MATPGMDYTYGLGTTQTYSKHYRPAWCDMLDVPATATVKEIQSAYRKKAMVCHPDHGGSVKLMQALNEAYRSALRK